MRYSSLLIAFVSGALLAPRAHACSTHGLVQAATLDAMYGGEASGVVHGSLSIASSLVPPTSSTTCTAGIGLGSSNSPLPAGLEIVAAAIVVVHANGSRTPLSAFSFAPNAVTSAALARGSGSVGAAGTNPLFAGSTWFGFSSFVNPFVLPTLRPGEFTAMEFAFEAAEALLPLTLQAQFSAGEGLASGAPNFSGDHPAQYFTATNPFVTLIASLTGDYNNNGTVDAADYIVWRNTVGQMGANLAADGNSNLQIEDGDYNVWRANFGRSSIGPVGSFVPEPSGWVIALGAMIWLSLCLRLKTANVGTNIQSQR
jgi:hypothetical protein